MRKCPNCGEVLQEHERVCRNCGAFLDVVTTPEEEPLFEEEDFPKKEEEKEQEDNKLRDLDGNEIKNDNVPQKGVQ